MKRAYLDKLSEFPQLYQSFPKVVPKWIMMKHAPLDKLSEQKEKRQRGRGEGEKWEKMGNWDG